MPPSTSPPPITSSVSPPARSSPSTPSRSRPARRPAPWVEEMSADLEAAHVQECRDWQATLADPRLGRDHVAGGVRRSGRHRRARPGSSPRRSRGFLVSSGVFMVAIGMVGPTIISHGTEEQKEFFLPRMLNGEHVWCQLFSEPGAGSDLAGLATRAERDGDELVVNGQKVWTSGAHFTDWGIMLARTNWDVPKHQGISWIAVDMRSPGIEVRPLRQITGYAHFNEVFLTDVRVPVDNIVGGIDKGWGVALTTLGNERADDRRRRFRHRVQVAARARAELRPDGGPDDPPGPRPLATRGSRSSTGSASARKARRRPGSRRVPRSSVMKLAVSQRVAADGDLALALEGPDGMLIGDDAPRRRDLPAAVPQPVVGPHRWRHRADPAQRPRRARPRAPRRGPPGQDRPVPRPPPQLTRLRPVTRAASQRRRAAAQRSQSPE